MAFSSPLFLWLVLLFSSVTFPNPTALKATKINAECPVVFILLSLWLFKNPYVYPVVLIADETSKVEKRFSSMPLKQYSGLSKFWHNVQGIFIKKPLFKHNNNDLLYIKQKIYLKKLTNFLSQIQFFQIKIHTNNHSWGSIIFQLEPLSDLQPGFSSQFVHTLDGFC